MIPNRIVVILSCPLSAGKTADEPNFLMASMPQASAVAFCTNGWYIDTRIEPRMIVSFRDGWLRDLALR
jgi:hypothetical protein